MKAINCPLRPRVIEDMLRGFPSARTRAALKKYGRKQLRAAERQLFLKEGINGMFIEMEMDRREAKSIARAQAAAANRVQSRARRDVRRMLDQIQESADHQLAMVADLRYIADRVLVEVPVRVLGKAGAQTVMVRASCAV